MQGIRAGRRGKLPQHGVADDRGETPFDECHLAGLGEGHAQPEPLQTGLHRELALVDRQGADRKRAAEHPDPDEVHDASRVGERVAVGQLLADIRRVQRALPEVSGRVRVKMGRVLAEVRQHHDLHEARDLLEAQPQHRVADVGRGLAAGVVRAVARGDDPGGERRVGVEQLGELADLGLRPPERGDQAREDPRPARQLFDVEECGDFLRGHGWLPLIDTPGRALKRRRPPYFAAAGGCSMACTSWSCHAVPSTCRRLPPKWIGWLNSV